MQYFVAPENYIRKSTQNRLNVDPDNLCTWGVDYLDKHFGGGIAPRSFNLIACESGKGKTTLVSNMAVQNSMRGKKVAFIRLEGDMYDFADTEKWKIIYDDVYKMSQSEENRFLPDYQSFRLNNIPGIESLEKKAEDELLKRLKNVFLFNKADHKSFSRDTIKDVLKDMKDVYDLIIIDHLHYFETVDERQQYKEQMESVKIINDFVDDIGTPVVLVSHVRKRDSRAARQLLKLEDIQGSSDIFKIAHTVLMMSPYYEEYDNERKLYPTLFYSPKSRYGASTTAMGIKIFDGKSKQYIDGFEEAKQLFIKGEWKIERQSDRPKHIGSNNF
tara:strand:+ start:3269 stop:4258 length:990 start_codon:yes stop_codon:yes gene_type:complete